MTSTSNSPRPRNDTAPRNDLAQRERRALCDLLLQVGPDAPTLCEGWDARDLVAHLLVRENRPDAAAGMALPFLSGHLERTSAAMLAGGFETAVNRLRSGPPRLSPTALTRVDAAANTAEFFIHHEDVRRAQPGWEPRELAGADTEKLWAAARMMGRTAMLRDGDGLVLVTPDGPRAKVSGPRAGGRVKVVTGPAAELLLWVSGRTGHARVTVD